MTNRQLDFLIQNSLIIGSWSVRGTRRETHDFLAGLHPLGRMGETREVVEAVLYLESAGFVTGETLHVDGRAHAGHW